MPGLLLDVDFLSFAASMTTFLFVVVEVCSVPSYIPHYYYTSFYCVVQLVRVVRVWPCGEALQEYLDPLCADRREGGPLILSHLYLLLGHCVPLWISPHTGGEPPVPVPYPLSLSLSLSISLSLSMSPTPCPCPLLSSTPCPLPPVPVLYPLSMSLSPSMSPTPCPCPLPPVHVPLHVCVCI